MKLTISTLVLFLIGMSFAAGGGPNSGGKNHSTDGSQTPGVTQNTDGTCNHDHTDGSKGGGKPQGAGQSKGAGKSQGAGQSKNTGTSQDAGQSKGTGKSQDAGQTKGTANSQDAGQSGGNKSTAGSQHNGSKQKGGKRYGLSQEFNKGMPADLQGKVDALKEEADKKREIINEATPEQAQVIRSRWRKGSKQKKDAAIDALPQETRGKVRGMLNSIDKNNTNKEADMRQRVYGRDRLQDPDKKKTTLNVE